MSLLHTVNKSPFTHSTLSSCLDVIAPGDALLLIEDGIYGSLDSSPLIDRLLGLQEDGVDLFALVEDVKARGLLGKTCEEFTNIRMTEFVKLSADCDSVKSWF